MEARRLRGKGRPGPPTVRREPARRRGEPEGRRRTAGRALREPRIDSGTFRVGGSSSRRREERPGPPSEAPRNGPGPRGRREIEAGRGAPPGTPARPPPETRRRAATLGPPAEGTLPSARERRE